MHKNGTSVPVGLSAQCLKKADGAIDAILILVQETPHHTP
jgi:ribosomal protein L28